MCLKINVTERKRKHLEFGGEVNKAWVTWALLSYFPNSKFLHSLHHINF
jgi:hypothetical protein